MQERLGDFSIREKNLWFELLVDVAVALYYWPQALRLIHAGGDALTGRAMTNLVVGTVMLAIVFSTVLSLLLHRQQKPEPMDERDQLIRMKGLLYNGRVLTYGVLAVMGIIVTREFGWWPHANATLPPLVIAHMLLLVLMVASLVNSATQLYRYRRGY